MENRRRFVGVRDSSGSLREWERRLFESRRPPHSWATGGGGDDGGLVGVGVFRASERRWEGGAETQEDSEGRGDQEQGHERSNRHSTSAMINPRNVPLCY